MTALRAQLRAAQQGNPPPPPKRGKTAEVDDIRDKAAERAERMSLAQHQTSLLKTQPRTSRLEAAKERKRGIPFIFQLLAVLVLAGGAALALDPSLMAYVQPYLAQLEPHIQSVRAAVGL